MKKFSAVICLLFLFASLTSTAFAQKNANAYFLLDTDLKTTGYQGMSEVMNVGGTAKVGFAIYAKQWEESKGITVLFEWDGTKATYRASESGLDVIDNDIAVNGVATFTLPAEKNILGGSTITAGTRDETGLYTNSYALSGGDAATATDGLVFFAVFRTVSGFLTTNNLTIKASVTVADAAGNTRFLGTRFFHVNQSVDVKPATWKEVKEQFKDF